MNERSRIKQVIFRNSYRGSYCFASRYQTVHPDQHHVSVDPVHELSIALSILEGVAEEAERQGGAQVHAIHLRLGPLSGVVKEALNFSFDLAREGTPFERSLLVIEEIPITISCPTCRAERAAVSVQRLCCSVCGTPSSGIVHGNELEISSLEIDA